MSRALNPVAPIMLACLLGTLSKDTHKATTASLDLGDHILTVVEFHHISYCYGNVLYIGNSTFFGYITRGPASIQKISWF
jgi:hypothetical protein